MKCSPNHFFFLEFHKLILKVKRKNKTMSGGKKNKGNFLPSDTKNTLQSYVIHKSTQENTGPGRNEGLIHVKRGILHEQGKRPFNNLC